MSSGRSPLESNLMNDVEMNCWWQPNRPTLFGIQRGEPVKLVEWPTEMGQTASEVNSYLADTELLVRSGKKSSWEDEKCCRVYWSETQIILIRTNRQANPGDTHDCRPQLCPNATISLISWPLNRLVNGCISRADEWKMRPSEKSKNKILISSKTQLIRLKSIADCCRRHSLKIVSTSQLRWAQLSDNNSTYNQILVRTTSPSPPNNLPLSPD